MEQDITRKQVLGGNKVIRPKERCQFPECIGAIDGKHIITQPPGNSGSYYYNYKHTNSIVLMAVTGPNYECLSYDIGTNGRVNDGGVWNKCILVKALQEGKMNLPLPCCLPRGNKQVPYVLVWIHWFLWSLSHVITWEVLVTPSCLSNPASNPKWHLVTGRLLAQHLNSGMHYHSKLETPSRWILLNRNWKLTFFV